MVSLGRISKWSRKSIGESEVFARRPSLEQEAILTQLRGGKIMHVDIQKSVIKETIYINKTTCDQSLGLERSLG